MALKIGTFFIENGSSSGDNKSNIKSGEAYFGKEGNDQISSNAFGTLYHQGSYWLIPSILSGGPGNDTYNVGNNDFSIIYDAASSTSDVLNISAYISYADTFFTLDNRHLYLGFSYNNSWVLIADGINNKGAIEKISFSDMSFNGSPDSINILVNNYSQGDISLEYAITSGIFNPSAVGVNGASEVRSLLDNVYNESNKASANSAPRNLYVESNNYSYWDSSNTHIRIQEGLREKTTIGLLSTDDDDDNDTHTFHIVQNDTQYPDYNYFIVEGNKLKIKSTPDHEIKSSYAILLYAEDSAGNQTEDNYYVNIKTDNLSEKTYNNKFESYKFYKLNNGQYQLKDASVTDSITGLTVLNFQDQSINVDQDIIGKFDQVTGLNTASGKMFRLYNAAFARFPDADGLKYWIGEFSSGRNSERVVAQSFLASAEFKARYGVNISNATYVETLYVNVLGRDYDQNGYNYWLGNLNAGIETRYELLLGFAESAENKAIFTEMTGLG